VTESSTFTTLESEDEDLGDRLLEVLPGDGGTIGNLALGGERRPEIFHSDQGC